MSLTCQYEQLKTTSLLGEIVRQVTVEARLNLPEGSPRLHKIRGGGFLIESPELAIEDGWLRVNGNVCPHLVYGAEAWETADGRHVDRDSEVQGNQSGDGRSFPMEYGIRWQGEQGVSFEESFEIPGLTEDMAVDVECKPGAVLYERENQETVVFRGNVDLVVHTIIPQTFEVVSEIDTLPSGKVNVQKEQVLLEEGPTIKKTTHPVRATLLLPDYKPEVDRILNYFVKPVAIEGLSQNGKIGVRGMLEVTVFYVGHDEMGHGMEIFGNEWKRETETAIPFEVWIDSFPQNGRMLTEPRVTVKYPQVEIRTVHELGCQVELECEVKIRQIHATDLVLGVTPTGEEIIDTEEYLLNLEEFETELQGEVEFGMNLNLPVGYPDMERLLGYQGNLESWTFTEADRRLELEGQMTVEMYYVADGMENQRLFQAGWERRNGNGLTVDGFLEAPDLPRGVSLRSQVVLDTLKLEMTGARTVRVQGILKAVVDIKKPRAMTVVKNCALVTPVDPESRPSMLFYIVQPEDTLWKIARTYQTTMETLTRANQLPTSSLLDPGRKLLIPKG